MQMVMNIHTNLINDKFGSKFPKSLIPVPIVLLRAEQSEVVYNGPEDDLSWGWDALATEAVDVHFVPGDHRSMMEAPHVRTLAEILKKVLRQAEARS